MGARGPHKLRIINGGEPESAADVTVADVVQLGAPDPPKGMSPGQKLLWDRLVPLLDKQGLVSPVDGLTIDLMLRSYLAAVQASDELAGADSIALEDEKNHRFQKHPADAILRLHSELYLKYAQQIGMTFAARARLAAEAANDDDDDNPFLSPSEGQAGGGS